ncbi:MAG: non-heme iron oxygenase ferredoxin subunit [Candidatus Aenigmarchaeota archaeon]|nr:non-heme iron oxygenase ferredoxin subunit [Candidatus Aenigmarchaeota archaeon]
MEVKIGKLSDFTEGKMQKVIVNGKDLLVVNIGGTIYSIDDLCTHEECSLADGFIRGEVVTCPCHLAQFNVKTGKKVANPATGVNIADESSFKVKVENNEVFVEV